VITDKGPVNALVKWLICFSLAGLIVFIDLFPASINAAEKTSKNSLVLTVPSSDGVLIQYAIATFKEVSKRTGINIEILQLPKKRALVTANHGDADGVTMRVINLEKDYPNLIRVKTAVFTVQHIIYSNKSDLIQQAHDFKSLHNLVVKKNYKVGFLLGSKKAKDELSSLPVNNKLALSDPIQAFSLLETGRIEAYLAGPGIVNRSTFNQQFNKTDIQEVGVFANFPLYPYVHESHRSIIPILEAALRSMKEDGTLNSIRRLLEK